jgi:hypothetical protein
MPQSCFEIAPAATTPISLYETNGAFTIAPNSTITLEAWYQFTNGSTAHRIFELVASDASKTTLLQCTSSGTSSQVTHSLSAANASNSGAISTVITGQGTGTSGAWIHVVAQVALGTDTTPNLWVNGTNFPGSSMTIGTTTASPTFVDCRLRWGGSTTFRMCNVTLRPAAIYTPAQNFATFPFPNIRYSPVPPLVQANYIGGPTGPVPNRLIDIADVRQETGPAQPTLLRNYQVFYHGSTVSFAVSNSINNPITVPL